MKPTTYIFLTVFGLATTAAWSQTPSPSFQKTTVIKVAGKLTAVDALNSTDAEKQTIINYHDNFGGPLQVVMQKASPLGYDIVQPAPSRNVYDADSVSYLPYVSTGQNGDYRSNALKATSGTYVTGEQYLFYQGTAKVAQDYPASVSNYDTSPLFRVIEQGSFGADWQPGTNHTVKQQMGVNRNSDTYTSSVKQWTTSGPTGSFYAEGTLSVGKMTDPNGNNVYTFVNKIGQKIAKRVQLNETLNLDGTNVSVNFLETYYVYDDRGNLALQIPPKAAAKLNSGTTWSTTFRDEWCFMYTYDEKNRLVEKKTPDAAPIYYAYDPMNRPVLVQDGNIRAANKWWYTKYDRRGRVVTTGLYTNTTHTTRATIQQNVLDVLNYSTIWFEERANNATYKGYTNQLFPTTNATIWVVTYYDDYDFDLTSGPDFPYAPQNLPQETTATTRTRGRVTGSTQLIPGTSTWLTAYVFYDNNGRVIQTRNNNHLRQTIDNLKTNVYDFEGKLLTSKIYHNAGNGTQTIINKFDYSGGGRLWKVWQSNNGSSDQLLVEYEYNELGQLVDKKLHNTGGTNFLQSVDLRYNIAGQLTSINNAQLTVTGTNDDTNDLFGMEIVRNTVDASLANTAQYNGNISAVKWKGPFQTSGAVDQRSHKFVYDKADRLKTSTFQANTGTNWTKETNTLNESQTYDHNGNILTLTRSRNERGFTIVSGLPVITSTAQTIDNLTYTYASTFGNKLTKVEDAVTGTVGEAGFKNGDNITTEYTYNSAGSIASDENKDISSIQYNEQGKTKQVTFYDGRYITYAYDAGGTKLTIKTYSTTGVLQTTTDYVGGFVYENNALSFFSSPEGRVVKNGSNLEYQYSIADHQGNTRLIFTSVSSTPEVTLATFEDPAVDAQKFVNVPDALPHWASSFSGNHTPSGAKVIMLNQNLKVAAARSFNVYPGDQVDIEVYNYYTNNSGFGTTRTGLSGLITQVATALILSNGGVDPGGKMASGVNSALGPWDYTSGTGDTAPCAYLNYILFDKDYKVLDMGWQPANGLNALTKLSFPTKLIKEAGQMFVYLSYESESNQYVQFDDLKITHTKSNVIQYNEYYTFGLQTANSWTRENVTGNKHLYNAGSELQATTQWHETPLRMYDAVLGRFNGVDIMADMFSALTPYNYSGNNPSTFNDPTGAIFGGEYWWNSPKSMWGGRRLPSDVYPQYEESSKSGGFSNGMYGHVSLSDKYAQVQADAAAVNSGQMSREAYHAKYGEGPNGFIEFTMAGEDGVEYAVKVNFVNGSLNGISAGRNDDKHGRWVILFGGGQTQSKKTAPQTWYYMTRENGFPHGLAYDPFNNMIYEVNHPKFKGEERNGLLSKYVDGGPKSVAYQWQMLKGGNMSKDANEFWAREAGSNFLLMPVIVQDPDAATAWFQSRKGTFWDYDFFSNNCSHFAFQGLSAGGCNVGFLGPAPTMPGTYTMSWRGGAAPTPLATPRVIPMPDEIAPPGW